MNEIEFEQMLVDIVAYIKLCECVGVVDSNHVRSLKYDAMNAAYAQLKAKYVKNNRKDDEK